MWEMNIVCVLPPADQLHTLAQTAHRTPTPTLTVFTLIKCVKYQQVKTTVFLCNRTNRRSLRQETLRYKTRDLSYWIVGLNNMKIIISVKMQAAPYLCVVPSAVCSSVTQVWCGSWIAFLYFTYRPSIVAHRYNACIKVLCTDLLCCARGTMLLEETHASVIPTWFSTDSNVPKPFLRNVQTLHTTHFYQTELK